MPMVITQGGGNIPLVPPLSRGVNKESVGGGKIFEFISLKKFSQVYSKIIYIYRYAGR